MTLDRLVPPLLSLGRPLVSRQRPGVPVCVLSTRVVVEVLGHFGEPARPWPCRLVTMDSIAANGYLRGLPWPEIFAAGGTSAGQAGTGAMRSDGTWDGHLAALVEHCGEDEHGREKAVLVDLSLADHHRPHLGIHAAPLGATVPQAAIDSGERIFIPLDQGGLAMYEPITSDLWSQCPDWRRPDRWSPLVVELVRALR